jgi:phosphatidylglycerophosphate synthase
MWLTLPNALSFFRLLLGLAFAWLPIPWRLPAVIVGALSDGLDGLLSRSTNSTSAIGRALDPIADKVFVAGVLFTLVLDGNLTLGQLTLLALRDVAVAVRAVWLLARRHWTATREVRPTMLGKLTTALQFLFLLVVLWTGEVVTAVFVPAVTVSGLAGAEYLFRPMRAPGKPADHTAIAD